MDRLFCLIACTATVLLSCVGDLSASDKIPDGQLQSQWRRPVSIALLDGGRILAVGNRDSGSISLVTTAPLLLAGKEPLESAPEAGAYSNTGVDSYGSNVITTPGMSSQGLRQIPFAEYNIADRLSSMTVLPDGRHLLVTDSAKNELLLLSFEGDTLSVRARLGVPDDPFHVIATSSKECIVTSRWGRAVSKISIDLGSDSPLELRACRSLPCEAGLATTVPGTDQIVVADAFGGNLMLLRLEDLAVESSRDVPGHAIRGLTWSARHDGLVVVQQTINPLARTESDDIHWGMLATSVVRVLIRDALLDPEADLLRSSLLIHLSRPGNGAADPAGYVELNDEDQRAFVLSQARDELVQIPGTHRPDRFLPLGRGPSAMIPLPDSPVLVVSNRFDDTLTVINTESMAVTRTFSLGPSPSPGPAESGEALFYSGSLSLDGWLSCHSCHTDGHASGILADTKGDLTFGAPKRVPSLLGTAGTGPWGWTGHFAELDDQIRSSITSTMHGRGAAAREQMVSDLKAYLVSLSPAPPAHDVESGEELGALIEEGRKVFASRTCASCHRDEVFTTAGVFDVGLIDENGHREFNPPSLRGVGRRTRYLHDGRAKTLRDLFTKYQHPRETRMSEDEVEALVAFLKSL